MAVWVHVAGLGEDPLRPGTAVRNGEDHPNNLGCQVSTVL